MTLSKAHLLPELMPQDEYEPQRLLPLWLRSTSDGGRSPSCLRRLLFPVCIGMFSARYCFLCGHQGFKYSEPGGDEPRQSTPEPQEPETCE